MFSTRPIAASGLPNADPTEKTSVIHTASASKAATYKRAPEAIPSADPRDLENDDTERPTAHLRISTRTALHAFWSPRRDRARAVPLAVPRPIAGTRSGGPLKPDAPTRETRSAMGRPGRQRARYSRETRRSTIGTVDRRAEPSEIAELPLTTHAESGTLSYARRGGMGSPPRER
jgi:hypothetical protein